MLDLPEQLGPLRTMQAAATDQGSREIRLASPRLRYRPEAIARRLRQRPLHSMPGERGVKARSLLLGRRSGGEVECSVSHSMSEEGPCRTSRIAAVSAPASGSAPNVQVVVSGERTADPDSASIST